MSVERTSFFEEQARRRRQTWRGSFVCGLAASVMGAPLAVLLTPPGETSLRKDHRHRFEVRRAPLDAAERRHPEVGRRAPGAPGRLSSSHGLTLSSGDPGDENARLRGRRWGGGDGFFAYDKKTGEILTRIRLPGTQTGLPITYMHQGRQYIVVSVGDADRPAALVALALPRE